jgi:hypothetical protein
MLFKVYDIISKENVTILLFNFYSFCFLNYYHVTQYGTKKHNVTKFGQNCRQILTNF